MTANTLPPNCVDCPDCQTPGGEPTGFAYCHHWNEDSGGRMPASCPTCLGRGYISESHAKRLSQQRLVIRQSRGSTIMTPQTNQLKRTYQETIVALIMAATNFRDGVLDEENYSIIRSDLKRAQQAARAELVKAGVGVLEIARLEDEVRSQTK